MSPRNRSTPDPRHCQFRHWLEWYWLEEHNELIPTLPWGPGEAGALGAFLRAHAALTVEQFKALLRYRLQSEDHARGESPRVWLSSLSRYSNGPLDRYKLPKRAARGEATVGMHESTQPVSAEDTALDYWRLVRGKNAVKFQHEAPAGIKAALAAEDIATPGDGRASHAPGDTMRKLTTAVLILAIAPFAIHAQQAAPKTAAPAVVPARQLQPALPVAPTIAPLSEMEKTRLDNILLQQALLQAQAQQQAAQLDAQRRQLVAEIERAHPGYHWQQGRREGEPSGLVPDAKPVTKK